jgi:hypothetical protein
MDVAKHVAEAIGLATPGKLDKEEGMATVKTVRNKMRKLMSMYERKTGRTIPPEIHDSMAPVSTPASLPSPKWLPIIYLLTREKVHQRRAQVQDWSVYTRKGTHVLNDRELRRHGGVILAA